jgi:mannose-6-phosphate isomerase-like protein (cupin superfamily)
MSAQTTPFAVLAGEGKQLETPTGDRVTIKAHTRNTNGSMSVHEIAIEPESGPALHTHLREDELWWVLEGEFRFKAGDAMLHAAEGGMAFGPRGVPHAFQNVGTTRGRLLVITTPSGLERFFEQFADLLPGPLAGNELADVGMANWIEFTGPPLAVSDPI